MSEIYPDEDFTKRLFDSKDDSKWRAATELNRLSKELDEKRREIYHWRLLVGRMAELNPDMFPYPNFANEPQRSVEDIKGRVDAYIARQAEKMKEAAAANKIRHNPD
jgi:hypothetical protein